jgi:chromosome segregation ATPase
MSKKQVLCQIGTIELVAALSKDRDKLHNTTRTFTSIAEEYAKKLKHPIKGSHIADACKALGIAVNSPHAKTENPATARVDELQTQLAEMRDRSAAVTQDLLNLLEARDRDLKQLADSLSAFKRHANDQFAALTRENERLKTALVDTNKRADGHAARLDQIETAISELSGTDEELAEADERLENMIIKLQDRSN